MTQEQGAKADIEASALDLAKTICIFNDYNGGQVPAGEFEPRNLLKLAREVVRLSESAPEGHVQGRWCQDLHCSRCYSADTWQKAALGKISEEQIIAAFSAGASGELARYPTHQPNAPLLTNEQIVWVVRRFLAGRTITA